MLTQPLNLTMLLAMIGLVPLVVVVATSFLKISVVLMLLRNALGIQQTPPNIAIYGLALILSLYVMMPPLQHAWRTLADVVAAPEGAVTLGVLLDALAHAVGPIRDFLLRNTTPANLDFFLSSTRRLWPAELADAVRREDLLVVVPAFAVTELTAAFQIGFLLFLPFAVIDLVVQSILLALGMMMMSPMTLALPLKLLLFVLIEGWTNLIPSLILSYA